MHLYIVTTRTYCRGTTGDWYLFLLKLLSTVYSIFVYNSQKSQRLTILKPSQHAAVHLPSSLFPFYFDISEFIMFLLWPWFKCFFFFFAKKNTCARLMVKHNPGALAFLVSLSFTLTWHTSWDLLLTERSVFIPPTEAEVRRDEIDCCRPNWTCVELQAATR